MSTTSPPHGNAAGKYSLKNRVIASCLTCRSRKVRCDKKRPVCTQCTRRNRPCSYLDKSSSSNDAGRKGSHEDAHSQTAAQLSLKDRVKRLEKLIYTTTVEQADSSKSDENSQNYPSPASMTSAVAGLQITEENGQEDLERRGSKTDGILIQKDGKSQFISSLHWARIGDEVSDLSKILNDDDSLNDTSSDEDESVYSPLNGNTGEHEDSSPISYLAFPKAYGFRNLSTYYPESAERCQIFLETYISHCNSIIRIVHLPTLVQQFNNFVQFKYNTNSPDSNSQRNMKSFEPLFFAVLFAAANSMTDDEIVSHFTEPRIAVLNHYQRGVEIALARQDFMLSQKLEVFQAFMILMTVLSKEDDMARTWALTGLAFRIAQGLGLHRDPSNFPSDDMDVVQVEVRRRLYFQLCHLDLRSSEGRGTQPITTETFYDTRMPRNVNDIDLKPGQKPSPEDGDTAGFTDMSMALMRFEAMSYFRKVVIAATYNKILDNESQRATNDTTTPNGELSEPAKRQESHDELAQRMYKLFEEFTEKLHKNYIQYCTEGTFEQVFACGLMDVLRCKFWILFYHQFSREFREQNWSIDFRKRVFEVSVQLIENTNSVQDLPLKVYNWHVNSHCGLHASIHILSELCSKSFQGPDLLLLRERGWHGIQTLMVINSGRKSKPWKMLQKMVATAESYRNSQMRPVVNESLAPEQTMTGMQQQQQFYVGQNGDQQFHFGGDTKTALPVLSLQQNMFPQSNPQIEVCPTLPQHEYSFDWTQWDQDVSQYTDVLRTYAAI